MLVRAVVEESARKHESISDDTVTLLLADIEKAYPNVPWNLAWEIFTKLGMPKNMLERIKGINMGTRYVIRTAIGDSKP